MVVQEAGPGKGSERLRWISIASNRFLRGLTTMRGMPTCWNGAGEPSGQSRPPLFHFLCGGRARGGHHQEGDSSGQEVFSYVEE